MRVEFAKHVVASYEHIIYLIIDIWGARYKSWRQIL